MRAGTFSPSEKPPQGAKGFGIGVTEYKKIAIELKDSGILDNRTASKLRILAGYRNRMVHFYDEISAREMYEICTQELDDVQDVLTVILSWIKENPDKVDRSL